MARKKKHKVDLTKLTVNELRQRMFVKRSEALYGSKYTYNDDVGEQIEDLKDFTDWESFSENWDVYWVGLNPRTLRWESGRHNSPLRKVVHPVRIIPKNEGTGRMIDSYIDRQDAAKIEVPFKEPLDESEEDRIISESLSGRVVIDEANDDKAIRLIEKNMELLQSQLNTLMKGKK